MPVTVITGLPGVGKSALAVHWACQAAGRFPDGQLYVNLRGFSPAGSPVTPGEALHGFLHALAVPPERVPADLEAQAGLYRSMLAGRRILVVADNARDAEQVRPLLPGAPGSAVVVTSRNSLSSLITADGARLLTLDLLTPPEAAELLAERVGARRVAADWRAAADITTACAGLPLALAIVAARASACPEFPLEALARQLRDGPALDALETEDQHADVRAVFSWSCRQLGPAADRAFRLLGLHPGPEFGLPAAASMVGLPTSQASRALSELALAHLITEPVPGRFAFHDLLRAYAAEQAGDQNQAPARDAALRRMLDHYLHTAQAAAHLLEPHQIHGPIALSGRSPGTAPETLANEAIASRWFETELPALSSAIRQAAASGHNTHAWQLSWMMTDFLERQGRWRELAAVHRIALEAARDIGDRRGQARSRATIGRACGWLGSHDEAADHFSHALAMFAGLGDQPSQAAVHVDLAWALGNQNRPAEALGHANQALALSIEAGHRAGQARALNCVGWYHAVLHDHHQALACCEQALALLRQTGDRHGQAATLDSIGYAHQHLGRYRQAVTCYRQALKLNAELDDRYYESVVLGHLGDAHCSADEPAAARASWQAALEILDQLHHPDAAEIRVKLRSLDDTSSG